MAELSEPCRKHREVPRFVIRHRSPVAVVTLGHAAEAVHRVPGKIDRVEFDVRNRVHQRGASFPAPEAAPRHLARHHQPRPRGTARRADRQRYRITLDERETPFGKRPERFQRQGDLLGGFGAIEAPLGGGEQAVHPTLLDPISIDPLSIATSRDGGRYLDCSYHFIHTDGSMVSWMPPPSTRSKGLEKRRYMPPRKLP